MKNIYFCVILFVNCLFNINCLEEIVRVNIIGYPKLDKFSIIINEKSELKINGKKLFYKNLEIFPHESKVICNGEEEVVFDNIDIQSSGIVVFNSFAGDQEYEGDFFIKSHNDSIDIINCIGIDDYFASVLGSEMGGGFSDEALKACAVAIRTYYYKKKSAYKPRGYDINNADGIDMVYRGCSYAAKRMYEAFADTENMFIVDGNNSLVLPLFHSTSGGVILKDIVMRSGFNDNIEDPVLLIDVDEKKNPLSSGSPYFKFSEELKSEDIFKIISSKIKLRSLKFIKLKYFNKTKCVDYIGFTDSNDKIFWLKSYEFVSLAQKNGFYNIRSIQFSVDKIGDTFYFKGAGFGHLCGMSQYSAEALAGKGYSYIQILNKYYPDYWIKTKGFVIF